MKPMFVALLFLVPLSYLLKKNKAYDYINEESGRAFWLFPASIFIGIISSLPSAGKGYDTYYFIYVMKTIPERGLNLIWKTDRPLYYLITVCLRNIFQVFDPKLSVALSGVFGVVLFISATYVLAKTLFDGETASYSALVTSSMFLLTQMNINFIGSLYGLAFMYLYTNNMINYYRYRKPLDALISTCMILIAVQVHLFSAFFIGGIIGLYFIVLKSYKPILITGLQGLLIKSVVDHSYASTHSFNTLSSNAKAPYLPILRYFGETLQGLQNGFSSEYFWVMALSLAGIWVLFRKRDKLFTVWTMMVIATMFYTRVYSGRIIFYYPFGLTAGYFMRILDHKKIKLALILLLIFVPLGRYQLNDRWLMVRYFEDYQIYPWDNYEAEAEQILWITQNYDVEDTVIVSDIPFLTPLFDAEMEISHPHLSLGVHYRVLSEVGNNLYIGSLTSLIENDFKGYGDMERHPYFGYYDNSTDKHLHEKTILIPDQIYNIGPGEMKLLEPLFTVPNTTQTVYKLREIQDD